MRNFKSITRKERAKNACIALKELIDKGTFTPLPNEIRKLKRKLEKRTLSYGQADNLILAIAEKYDAFSNDENNEIETIDIDLNISPEIVLKETFID